MSPVMITYCSLNFPEDGKPEWLNIDRQRVNQWPMILELQGLRHRLVRLSACDEWLLLGDRFLRLQNKESRAILAAAIRKAKRVVINDLVHAMEGQHGWMATGLPAWMPAREYDLVTNSQTRLPALPNVRVHHYDFLFNRTKAYYSGFPFTGPTWYDAGRENYRAPVVQDNASDKQKIFISSCRLYLDQDRTIYRKKLFDLTAKFSDIGYRSGPGRVPNGMLDKSATGSYLLSTTDDPLINFEKVGWSFNPETKRTNIGIDRLNAWRGAKWHGYSPVHNYYYDNTFISVYGETIEHGGFVVITEKTYEPLIKGHFILPFSSCGFLAALREKGFVLPNFIDYSYDAVEVDEVRFERYAAEVKRALTLPIETWRRHWRTHLDLLRHNQRLFYRSEYDRLNIFPSVKGRRPHAVITAESGSLIEEPLGAKAASPPTLRAGVIGLGKLGLPCAELMADYYEVEGYDVAPIRPKNFQIAGDIAAVCKGKDLIFIAVPTPHEPSYGGEAPSMHLPPRDFDYSIVKGILQNLNEHITRDQLVVLISTVLPGTTRKQLAPLATNYRLVYNPYLIAMGSIQKDMANPEMVILGTEDGADTGDVRRMKEFYAPLLRNNPRIVVGTWEEAECIKIFYNTFISAKLSLVNMIQDVAERIANVDVDVVTKALRDSTQRIMGPAYMTAGMGDGGSCHPRDNIALRWLAGNLGLGYDLFAAIMESRERQAENIAEFLVALAKREGLNEIWLHGETFKPGVPYTHGSYSYLVAHFIVKRGMTVTFIDPQTGEFVSSVRGVVLLAHNANFTQDQDAGQSRPRFYCRFEPGSIIVDPWRKIKPEDVPGCRLVLYGNTRLSRRQGVHGRIMGAAR